MRKQVQGRILNYRPDLPDQRDLIFKAPTVPTAGTKDLEPGLPGVMDQLNTSACSWNAICAHLGFIQLLQLQTSGKEAQEYDETKYVAPSRLFGYYNARALEGMQHYDSGAYLRDGIKTANKTGVCRESLWPYLPMNILKKPSAPAFIEAASYKISRYMRIVTLDDMIACIDSGFPFVYGFSVYSSFYSTSTDGLVPIPEKNERLYGGHAVTGCGYDIPNRLIKFRNSWGIHFGKKGNGFMPFDFITKYGSDFWTIRA